MSVHLYHRGPTAGETRLRYRWRRTGPAEQEMVLLLAGMAAEESAFGDPGAGALDDLAAASELALRLAAAEKRSATELLVAAHEEARALLEAHHEELAAVAAALLEHGTLTGRALAELLPAAAKS